MSYGCSAHPQEKIVPLWLQLIVTFGTSLAAAFVGSYLGRVSVSSQMRKRVTEVETEVAVLTSEYSKVLGLAKKISNRVALDDHRQKRTSRSSTDDDPPPPGDKRAAKAYYLNGKSHADIARMAMKGSQ